MTTTKKTTKKTTKLSSGKFLTATVKELKNGIVFTFPPSIKDQIKLNKKAYYSINNGVLQISGNEPYAVIPMVSLNDFTQTDPA
jgi:hypothetical protein